MKAEYEALVDKTSALERAIQFKSEISEIQREMMLKQYSYMSLYANILQMRIDDLEAQTDD